MRILADFIASDILLCKSFHNLSRQDTGFITAPILAAQRLSVAVPVFRLQNTDSYKCPTLIQQIWAVVVHHDTPLISITEEMRCFLELFQLLLKLQMEELGQWPQKRVPYSLAWSLRMKFHASTGQNSDEPPENTQNISNAMAKLQVECHYDGSCD